MTQHPHDPSRQWPGGQPQPGPHWHPGSPAGPPPPGGGRQRHLSRGQRVGLSGCAIVVGGFVALVIAGMALGPDEVVKEKKVPGPTVTVTAAGPTVTVTASPALPPPGTPQLTGGTRKDAQSRTATLEARSAYSDITLPADASAYAGWKVCAQEAQAADGVPAKITLYLGETSCPARTGDRLHPEPSPTPPAPPAQAPAPAPPPQPHPPPHPPPGGGTEKTHGGGLKQPQ
ncbi:hypothetical protein AB0O29_34145, partial [Streptomyces sp. NPDC089915]